MMNDVPPPRSEDTPRDRVLGPARQAGGDAARFDSPCSPLPQEARRWRLARVWGGNS
jgi:hypothetical protein